MSDTIEVTCHDECKNCIEGYHHHFCSKHPRCEECYHSQQGKLSGIHNDECSKYNRDEEYFKIYINKKK